MVQLHSIDTEMQNPNTAQIDRQNTLGMLRLINSEDQRIAFAVEKELPHIAQAVDAIYEKLHKGGRLIYCGAGTSGRLGVLDASECPPTFGVSDTLVHGIIAGGTDALTNAMEGAEDDFDGGMRDLKAIDFSSNDAAVGIAASGRTPYVLGAMAYARSLGAPTIGITSCENSELSTYVDVCIALQTGPEVITGSTRMKSGTAQKMVLNMLSTTAMIKLGKVYGNLMVDVKATNEKLVQRAISIVMTATDADEATAKTALEQCDYSCKQAIVMLLLNTDEDGAKKALEKADGHISRAL